MKANRKWINQTIETLLATKAHHVTKFVSPNLVVRATRVLLHKKIPRHKDITTVLTIGQPNYRERVYISDLKAAGEKFPVSKVWIIYPVSTHR